MTPEQLAAQEAEREKMLQESMQAEVVKNVMKELEKIMDNFENRNKIAFTSMQDKLDKRNDTQENVVKANYTSLEKYIEEVHNQQISDYEKLKKIVTDKAAGIYDTQIDKALNINNSKNNGNQGGGGTNHL